MDKHDTIPAPPPEQEPEFKEGETVWVPAKVKSQVNAERYRLSFGFEERTLGAAYLSANARREAPNVDSRDDLLCLGGCGHRMVARDRWCLECWQRAFGKKAPQGTSGELMFTREYVDELEAKHTAEVSKLKQRLRSIEGDCHRLEEGIAGSREDIVRGKDLVEHWRRAALDAEAELRMLKRRGAR